MPTEDEAAPPAPSETDLRAFFGDAYPDVSGYTSFLSREGVLRGLIGPREVSRLWERHILNSASVAQFLPATGTLLDVGSGAGLPGVVLAAMRPDLRVVLLEPMERRVAWLNEVVERLELGHVEVLRGRAEEVADRLTVDAVTARAVAPMDRLARWTMPLLRVGGLLLAMKGGRATEELSAARPVIRALGGDDGEVLSASTITGVPATTVVRVVRQRVPAAEPERRGARRARPRR